MLFALVSLLVVYLVLGGLVFWTLEHDKQQQQQQQRETDETNALNNCSDTRCGEDMRLSDLEIVTDVERLFQGG